jgi:hypothetical protein
MTLKILSNVIILRIGINEKKPLMRKTPKAAGENLLMMKLSPGIKQAWILPG